MEMRERKDTETYFSTRVTACVYWTTRLRRLQFKPRETKFNLCSVINATLSRALNSSLTFNYLEYVMASIV